ncbi:mitochondrial 54S ribosomal protein mL67 [Dipodascopsis tothii]|uniref:mitochondrial 54S ribosomal protein mL67 n=1 Tax=Dipodascopsis tothii TaxID=44089 RepID=UPI0034D01A29
MPFLTPSQAIARQVPAQVYLHRHRLGKVLVTQTLEFDDKTIGLQLKDNTRKNKRPTADRHDWEVLAVAQLPTQATAAQVYLAMLELRRKREKQYARAAVPGAELRQSKQFKYLAYTFETVADLSTALRHVHEREPAAAAPVVYWANEWFRGDADRWAAAVEHRRLDVPRAGMAAATAQLGRLAEQDA